MAREFPSMIYEVLAKVGASGDYLRVECAKCSERCELRFHGFDPSIPLVEIICPNHGQLWEGKLDGFDPVHSKYDQ